MRNIVLQIGMIARQTTNRANSIESFRISAVHKTDQRHHAARRLALRFWPAWNKEQDD